MKYLIPIIVTIFITHIGELFAEADWKSSYFIESSSYDFAIPDLGDSNRLLKSDRYSSYLFSGTEYSPPDDLPLGITVHDLAQEVEERQVAYGFVINAGITAIQLLPGDAKNNLLIGKRNLKELFQSGDPRRYQLEDTVNFSYSIFTAILGIDPGTADKLAGAVAIGSYAMNFKIMPYGDLSSSDRGDDPRGATFSRMGREYYYSGQYIKDYFYYLNSRYGLSSATERLTYASRTPMWQEAKTRMERREDFRNQEVSTASTSLRLQWKAITIAKNIEGDYSQVLKALKAQERARSEAEQFARQEKEREQQVKTFNDWLNDLKKRAASAEEERRKAEEKKRIEDLKKQADDDIRRRQEEAEKDAAKKKKMEEDEKSRALSFQQQKDNESQNTNSSNKPRSSLGGGGGSSTGKPSSEGIPTRMP